MTRVELGMWSGEYRRRACSSRRRSLFHTPHSTLPIRAGFTLIELLVVIMIIAILAALVLGVAAIAGETARESHSRHMVERLHTLMLEHYDSYRARRVKLNPAVETTISNSSLSTTAKGQALAEARLYAMREMMLMEIPDRWSDIILEKVEDFSLAAGPLKPIYLVDRTDLSNAYYRRFTQLIGRTNTLTGQPNTADDIRRNQGAECLYMVVTMACGDGEARSLFAENTIGDVDGDGAPEFLDGWGHPINFLRWAPGFDSQIQLNANTLGPSTGTTWLAAAQKDHDPFDLFRVDNKAFRLVPLIYSPGRDESSGLYAAAYTDADPSILIWRPTAVGGVAVASQAPYLSPKLTPYDFSLTPNQKGYMGTDESLIDPSKDRTCTDNIHNHLLGQR